MQRKQSQICTFRRGGDEVFVDSLRCFIETRFCRSSPYIFMGPWLWLSGKALFIFFRYFFHVAGSSAASHPSAFFLSGPWPLLSDVIDLDYCSPWVEWHSPGPYIIIFVQWLLRAARFFWQSINGRSLEATWQHVAGRAHHSSGRSWQQHREGSPEEGY